MRRMKNNEKGLATMVEATLLLPFCVLAVVGALYASLYLCQKANVQANLEAALTYYRTEESDTYVDVKTRMDYDASGLAGTGSSYSSPGYLNPYRFFLMSFKEGEYRQFFRSLCGHMFFADGDDVQITAERHNYVLYKTIEATATQTVKPPINLSMVGGPKEMKIQVSSKAVVNDGDDFIRNVDFTIDLLADTKVGEVAGSIGEKAKGLYEKFKNALHLEE